MTTRTTSLPRATVLVCALAGCAAQPADDHEARMAIAFDELQSGACSCSGVCVPGPSPAGVIALTFDDGPSASSTPVVLDVLARHGAPATFFVNGWRVPGNEALLARMVNEGHRVANHTFDHRGAVTECSGACLRSNVERTQQLIAPYQADGARYFRFPYGEADCGAIATVEALGVRVVGWDMDTVDWDFGGDGYSSRAGGYAYDFEGWVIAHARAVGGGVMLFHDTHANTASHLDSILTRLEAAGFRFAPLGATYFPELAFDGADAGAEACPRTLRWRGSAPIPDLGAATARIDVPDGTPAGPVTVSIEVRHPYSGDLVVALEHGGEWGVLRDRAGGPDNDIRESYELPASAPTSGPWTLRVSDEAALDAGNLDAFSLTFACAP